MCSLLNSSQSTNATKFTWTTPFFPISSTSRVVERNRASFLPASLSLSLSVHPENANPCPMKRARMASECDHRLMNDDQWDDFWYNLDARYQDLEHQPVPAPTKPQMTFSQEFHLAAEAKAREDAAALSRSRTNPKSHRCGACTACRASDCGRCKNCRDKPRCAFCASPQAAPRLRPAWHAGAPSPLAGCLRRRYAPSAEMRPLSLPRPVSPPAVSPPTNESFAVL